MPARDYALPPAPLFPFNHLLANCGLTLDPADISTRRRLRTQDVTDAVDLDVEFEEIALEPRPSPEHPRPPQSVPAPQVMAKPAFCRSGKATCTVASRGAKTEPQPPMIDRIATDATDCFELEDRSRPSVSSF